ncbi:clavesin-2-like isoform X1 [Episyrphus balteatus]|uniref:clavesin-2-like isoform X1 n=2 Tax=Episyrphus balteatus TaxID=286459 RepID=UPI0024854D90|nr:clavesin-2-like isoform X1 [Episyrphus balteatus]
METPLEEDKMSEYFEFQMNKRYLDTGSLSYLSRQQQPFNKNEARDRRKALIALKDMIGASMNFALKDKSCCTDDDFLNRFLYARKFRCNEAFELIINYHSYKQRNKVLLQKLNIFDETIQMALRDGNPCILKERDRRGRKVILFNTVNWEPTKYTAEDVYRAFLLTLDKLLEEKQNQALGFVVIVDWTNFTLRQSSHMQPKILKLMIEGLQDCFPAKFKAIHFIAQPWYVDIALAVIKPFLKDKTRERFKLHGTNLATLHECIAKDILPPDLGGEGPSVNTLDWYHVLLESSQTTEAPKSYRLIETTVYAKAPFETPSSNGISENSQLIGSNQSNS